MCTSSTCSAPHLWRLCRRRRTCVLPSVVRAVHARTRRWLVLLLWLLLLVLLLVVVAVLLLLVLLLLVVVAILLLLVATTERALLQARHHSLRCRCCGHPVRLPHNVHLLLLLLPLVLMGCPRSVVLLLLALMGCPRSVRMCECGRLRGQRRLHVALCLIRPSQLLHVLCPGAVALVVVGCRGAIDTQHERQQRLLGLLLRRMRLA